MSQCVLPHCYRLIFSRINDGISLCLEKMMEYHNITFSGESDRKFFSGEGDRNHPLRKK
jgi:hypothetical protein